MDKTNEVPTDDKIEEIEVRVEDTPVEPEKSELKGEGEDTPKKNETSEPASRDEKRSAGAVIAELGNEKKAIASKLVALASTNDEARKQVREMLLNDPSTANYLKSKFGDDYDKIVGDQPIEKKADVDVEKIREQERVKAQAEAIKAQMQSQNEKMLTEKAKAYGFTTEEFDLFKSKTEILGGDEGAMEQAALIVNHSKATASGGEYKPDGGEADKPVKRTVTITPGLNEFSESTMQDKKEFASDIARVKGLHRKDAYGKDVMDLPGL